MRHLCWILGLLVWLSAPAVLAASGEATAPPSPETKAPAATAKSGAPDITPEAAAPVTAMCQYMKNLPAFSFEATVESEQVYPNGQSILVSREMTVTFKRPNKMYSHVVGDDVDRIFVYDGKTVTMADPGRGVYAVIDAPPTMDATIAMLSEKYGLNTPLSGLFVADPCAELFDRVRTGDCVGSHQAAGKICDHLAFTQKRADWQLWVEQGKLPLPRKLVITDKEIMGWPQYAATFTKWDVKPRLADGLFTFTPAKDMRRIEFLPLVSPQGEKK